MIWELSTWSNVYWLFIQSSDLGIIYSIERFNSGIVGIHYLSSYSELWLVIIYWMETLCSVIVAIHYSLAQSFNLVIIYLMKILDSVLVSIHYSYIQSSDLVVIYSYDSVALMPHFLVSVFYPIFSILSPDFQPCSWP